MRRASSLRNRYFGRPSCTGGAEYLLVYCADRFTVIVADRDGPGHDGAMKLADRLWIPCGKEGVKVITPIHRKDAREWVKGGATRETVDAIIGNTPYHSMKRKGKDDGRTND